MRRVVAALVVVFVVATAGCSGVDGEDEADRLPVGGLRSLSGTAWTAGAIDGDAVLERVRTTLSFPVPGRIAGNGGCNRFSGAVELAGDAIHTGAVAATRMACPPAVMRQEARYFEALAAVVRWRTTADGNLQLLDAAGDPRLTLSAAPPDPPIRSDAPA